jgi:hypothetical protein
MCVFNLPQKQRFLRMAKASGFRATKEYDRDMDESLKSLKADDGVVKERLSTSEIGVRDMKELATLVTKGKVGSVMVHESDKSSAESRLQTKGIKVYGNTKVPRGYLAAYDKSEKMIGFYSL